MGERVYEADVVIAGGGLAGLTAAHELLDQGRSVLVIDKDTPERLGGLASESFGGILMVGTPHQRARGIRDSPDLAFSDWCRYGQFEEVDKWPRRWARFYCDHSVEYIHDFLDTRGVEFLPVVNWAERGLDVPGNSVPRWHVAWGTGSEIIGKLVGSLETHRHRDRLQFLFEHEVSGLESAAGEVAAVVGNSVEDGRSFEARGGAIVVASGGISGGDLSKVRQNWPKPWGAPPERLLNGGHRFADGMLHDRVVEVGGNVTYLDRQWHYATGVHHPERRRPNDGISLVPPRSALWVNALGERIRNPGPLTAYTDTRHLVESVCRQPGKYSWQVMNMKIARRELAVSGGMHMTAFREKKKLLMAIQVLLGNRALVDTLLREFSTDFVTGRTLPELVERMNEKNLYGLKTDVATLKAEIDEYDGMIRRGRSYFNDDQLRRILNFRTYLGDRVRTCKFQPILDRNALPLIAIREFIVTRKSLGGIQTDLQSRVLNGAGEPIPGLYAVGEAAGFGGGCLTGIRSLEGTFLGGCVLTGRIAGQSIGAGVNV